MKKRATNGCGRHALFRCAFLLSGILTILLTFPALVWAGDCNLTQVTSADITITQFGIPAIPVSVNKVRMDALVETQTPISFIDSATADRLGLKRKKLEPAFGPFTERVEVESLIIGQADFGKTILVVHQSDEDGGIVLGWGFLGRRDVDFDFPNGSLKLFAPDHCRGKVVYWTKDPYAILDYRLTPVGPGLTARLDGEKVQVIVSTGTKTTQIDFKAVKRLFRWRDRPPELSEVSDREGTDSTDPIYRYPFKTLSLGEIEIKAPKINLVDRADPKIVVDQLNLGMSTLGKLHIYFAAKEQKAYLTEGASNSQPPSSPNPGTTP